MLSGKINSLGREDIQHTPSFCGIYKLHDHFETYIYSSNDHFETVYSSNDLFAPYVYIPRPFGDLRVLQPVLKDYQLAPPGKGK